MQEETGTPLTAADEQRAAVSRARTGTLLGVAAGWVLLDQLTKIWAERSLTPGDPVPVIGELLRLHLTYNPGAAFSLGTGMTWVFTLLASVVVVGLVVFSRRVHSTAWALALGLLLGGAAGNLVDRLAREPGFAIGHVVDFLRLPNFPVFNVADIGITAAAVLIAILALRGIPPEEPTSGG